MRLESEDVETPLATAGHGEATMEKCESLFMASRTIFHLNPNFAQILCSLTQLVAPEATLCNEMHLAMALPGSFKLSTEHFVLIIHYITKISHYVCSIMLFVNPECFFPCCPRQKGHLRCCGVFDLQLLLQKNIFLAGLMPYVLWGCLSKDVHHVSLMPV